MSFFPLASPLTHNADQHGCRLKNLTMELSSHLTEEAGAKEGAAGAVLTHSATPVLDGAVGSAGGVAGQDQEDAKGEVVDRLGITTVSADGTIPGTWTSMRTDT